MSGKKSFSTGLTVLFVSLQSLLMATSVISFAAILMIIGTVEQTKSKAVGMLQKEGFVQVQVIDYHYWLTSRIMPYPEESITLHCEASDADGECIYLDISRDRIGDTLIRVDGKPFSFLPHLYHLH
ncbi:MAG: hypothetical protein WCT16_04835 [Candidatus Buchananbacteria bacterium]